METRKLKNIFKSVLLAAALFLCIPAFAKTDESAWYSVEELESRWFELYAENDYLQLFYDGDDSIMAVREKSNGYVWYSAPLKWEEDEEASGFVRNTMPSFLSVRAKDANSTFRNANSYVNSFIRGGLRVSSIKNGIRLLHNFKRDGFTIPLDVTLDGNSLVMSIPVNEIVESKDIDLPLELLDVQINPYFGCASKDEEGFIFVPDGSGAVISFDNHRSQTTYSQYVYGRDNSIVTTRRKLVTQDIALPVFGLSKENAGFIGVIESGAARATINAESCQNTSYNQVGAGFILRDFDSVSFRERTGTSRDVRIYESVDFASSEDVYTVRYIFLSEEENSLAGMAKAYRSYLQSRNMFPSEMTDKEPSLTLDFIGAADKKRTIAGFPMNVSVAYTKFSDVTETVKMLEAEGVTNFNVKFDGWTKGGILGRYPSKPKAAGVLGGRHSFKKMLQYLEGKDIDFYAGAEFVNLYKTDASHIKELSANRMINRSPVKIPDYRMSTYTDEKTSDKYPYWILRTSKIQKDYTSFMSRFRKVYSNLGLSPDSLGNTVSSDFVREGTTRTQTVSVFKELLEDTSSQNKVMLSRPFDYALAYTSYAADLPVTSSLYDVEDYSVPFYQMVLHGYIPYSNLPGNRSNSSENYKLKLIETCADVSYMWIVNHPDWVRDSRMQSYMNLYRDDWLKEAAEIYKEVAPVTSRVRNAEVTAYSVDGEKHITSYSNGITITVDYGTKTWTVTEGGAR